MLRTLVLVVASLSIVLVGFAAYTYRAGEPLRPTVRPKPISATQPIAPFKGEGLSVRGTPVRGGAKPYVVVYDDDGEPKYQFRSSQWEPVSEVEFKLVDPEVCVFMPGGQKTRIEAEHGTIFVERSGGNNLNPKRGRLHGNVLIYIDRTNKAWRQANPDLADPQRHPDRVIKIWLDEIMFDLDQSYLKSGGTLRVQSTDVEIEGKGLTLAWNEQDNRIEELVIERGKRMELRRGGGMVSFGMPGQEREAKPGEDKKSASADKDKAKQSLKRTAAMTAVGLTELEDGRRPSAFIRRAVERGASANKALALAELYPRKKKTGASPKRTGRFSDEPAKPRKPLQLFRRDGKRRIGRKKDQIDTYLAVFKGDVVVEQRRGLKMLGRLSGVDRLELIFDVGQAQRSALRGGGATSRPASDDGEKPTPDTRPAAMTGAVARAPTSAPSTQPQDRTRLRLLWSGPLIMRPAEHDAKPSGRRFDARAVGSDVHIMDSENEVRCQQLIFSNETEQAWLYGSARKPVRMWSTRTRRLEGQEIYVDRKTGIAVVNGAGSMADTRQAFADIAVPGGSKDKDSPDALEDEKIELAWTKQVELEFGAAKVVRRDPSTGREVVKSREYIQKAAFRGGVSMKQGDQEIRADEVVMTMGVPTSAKGFVGTLEAVRATGGVTLVQQDSDIRSEKLSVTMIVDRYGRNVPKSATAYGNVSAKQGDRHIMAKDLLSITIGETRGSPTTTQAATSTSKPVLDPVRLEEVRRKVALRGVPPAQIDLLIGQIKQIVKTRGVDVPALEALAVAKGFKPEVVTSLLKPKKVKPRLAITEMHAFGDVVAVDPKQKLDVQAEELHASLPDGKMIDRATVIAKPNERARAELGDYVIHGHRIQIDVPRHFAEVPDAGWLRFISRQGLDGKRIDKPVPTKVEWSKHMRLEGGRNVADFEGDVVASSEASRLECDHLRINFVDLSPAEIDRSRKTVPAPSRWELVERMLFRKSATKSESTAVDESLRRRFTKKPVNALARGNVVVLSSVYDKQDPKRLLSRLRIAGPKLNVDLAREQLDLMGAGSLLIEDYRLPTPPKQQAGLLRRTNRPKDPLMGDVARRGPSQTVFTWANSMTYFLQNNLAVLDRSVSMVHLGGGRMALADDMAKAMDLEINKIRMKGRKSALTCENLTVEFLRNAQGASGSTPFDRAGSAELKRLIATGNIYLEDGERSLVGEELTYFRDKNVITVAGTPENRARLFVENPKTGRVFRYVAPLIRWNRNTGQIDAPGARVDNVGG